MTMIVLALGAALGAGTSGHGSGEPMPARPVVELFTSQGCSSCPPADRLVAGLGDRAVVLGFHVETWNSLGWRDPFSTPIATRRQREYATVFGAGRIYTPQVVVNGRREGVGSDQRWLDSALRSAVGETGAVLRLEAHYTAPDRLAVTAESVRRAASRATLMIALTESGLETPVPRGENARRTLRNDHVVRALVPGPTAEIVLDPGWKRDRLRAVAFLQEPASLRIHGGVEVTPLP
jgi:hypothetical protein